MTRKKGSVSLLVVIVDVDMVFPECINNRKTVQQSPDSDKVCSPHEKYRTMTRAVDTPFLVESTQVDLCFFVSLIFINLVSNPLHVPTTLNVFTK